MTSRPPKSRDEALRDLIYDLVGPDHIEYADKLVATMQADTSGDGAQPRRYEPLQPNPRRRQPFTGRISAARRKTRDHRP